VVGLFVPLDLVLLAVVVEHLLALHLVSEIFNDFLVDVRLELHLALERVVLLLDFVQLGRAGFELLALVELGLLLADLHVALPL